MAENYDIEDIRDIDEVEGVVIYLVKWLGYPPSKNTWEPIQNLDKCEDLIRKREQIIVRNLNRRYFPSSTKSNCEENVEKILDVFKFSGVQMAKVKFVNSERICFARYEEVKEKCPELLLNFFLHTSTLESEF